jgi:hypothetical protein
MIELFLLSFAVVGVAVVGMAIGVILSNRSLKGSCGGLGAIMGDDCMFCEKKDKCEKSKDKPLQIDEENGTIHLSLVE